MTKVIPIDTEDSQIPNNPTEADQNHEEKSSSKTFQIHRITNSAFGACYDDMKSLSGEIEKRYADAKSFVPDSFEPKLEKFISQNSDFYKGLEVDEKDNDFEGFRITPENTHEVERIIGDMINIMRDPKAIFKYLKNLDNDVGNEAAKRGITLSDNSPQYLICGAGNFIPGPCPQGYRPLRKEKILNELLLERERQHGFNLDGVALFAGFVDPEDADKFVKEGNLFSEDEQLGKLLLHGKYSHRLFFEIMRQAVESDDLDLHVDGQKLSQKQLLQILISTKVNSPDGKQSSWAAVLDSIDDNIEIVREAAGNRRQAILDPDNYNFSCRSPFVLKSLITCFGKDELPNLTSYLLDSYYKQLIQLADRVKESGEGSVAKIPHEFIAHNCLEAMTTGRCIFPGDVGENFAFQGNKEKRTEKTAPFSDKFSENIRRKIDNPKPVASHYYDSMEEYLKEKKGMNSEVAKDIVDSELLGSEVSGQRSTRIDSINQISAGDVVDSEFVGSAASSPKSARIDSINKILPGCCVIQ